MQQHAAAEAAAAAAAASKQAIASNTWVAINERARARNSE
jgi:hypothetical protein